MGWFNRLFQSKKDEARAMSTISTPSSWLLKAFGVSRDSANVTEDQALSLSAVLGCVKIISETIASFEIGVFYEDGRDIIEALDHPVNRLLKKQPSPLYTSFEYRETTQTHLLLRGNGYSVPVRDGDGVIQEIRIMNPNGASVYFDQETWKLFYRFSEEPNRIYDSEDVIHYKGLSTNGYIGRNPIAVARETFSLGLVNRKFGNQFYMNGAHPSGILQHPTKLSEQAQKRLLESFRDSHQGESNVGSVVLLEEGASFTPISISPVDMAFVETAKLQIEEVARIYRVPLHMLQNLDRATNNNIEQQSIDFVVHTMRPWVKRWEQELNRKLFQGEESGRYFVRFNMDSLLRGDAKSRGEFYSKLFNIGALSPNEIRKKENMNAREGGDDYFIPLSMSGGENIVKDEQE